MANCRNRNTRTGRFQKSKSKNTKRSCFTSGARAASRGRRAASPNRKIRVERGGGLGSGSIWHVIGGGRQLADIAKFANDPWYYTTIVAGPKAGKQSKHRSLSTAKKAAKAPFL